MKTMKTVENHVHNVDKGHLFPQKTTKMSFRTQKSSHISDIGKLGEDIATNWLMSKRFSIIDRNFRIRGGEIDIVARKSGVMHFVEVKTVSRETYDPVQNLSRLKVSHVIHTACQYRAEKGVRGPYQIDGIAIYLDTTKKVARVFYRENINI